MPPQIRTAIDIFHEASALAEGERRDFVNRVCPSDDVLRMEVISLLDAHDAADGFLERLVPPSGAARDMRERIDFTGQKIGRYSVGEALGEGGMGTVYVAEQGAPVRRKVALKVIKPGMDSKSVLARFETERQILAMMSHPGIAQIYDGGMTPSGHPYFVMELVEGRPITEYSDQRHLPVSDRLELFIQVCLAVQHAHIKGIIHRDLKPNNILVVESEHACTAKVIDFGVAKALDQDFSTTTILSQRFGHVIGTPKYMSPEQMGLSVSTVDTRSDVYSLGVTLYELLTGLLPYGLSIEQNDNIHGICSAVRDSDATRPSRQVRMSAERVGKTASRRQTTPEALEKTLRGELDWILLKALEKEPDRRYQSAGALGRDIQRYLDNEAVEACPPSASYRLRKFVSQYRGFLIATLLIVVTALLGSVFTSLHAVQARRATQRAIRTQRLAERRATEAQRATQEARQLLYAADMNFAGRCWNEARISELRDVLQRYAGPGESHGNLRGIEWWLLDQLSRSSNDTVIAQRDEQACLVRFSPDGRYCAIGWTDGSIDVRQALKLEPEIVFRGHGYFVYGCDFHPDGRSLATIADDGTIRIWDLATKQQTKLIDAFSGHGHRVAFVGDGSEVAASGEAGEVRFWNVYSGELVRRIGGYSDAKHAGTERRFAMSPRRDRLVIDGDGRRAGIFDAATGAEVCQLSGIHQTNWPRCFRFSRSARYVAAGMHDQSVFVWDARTGHKVAEFRGHTDDVLDVSFHPTEDLVASGDYSGVVRTWAIRDNTESAHERLKGWPAALQVHSDRVLSLDFSPDGERLVTGSRDNSVRQFSRQKTPTLQTQKFGEEQLHDVEFLRDDRTLLISSANGFRLCQDFRQPPAKHVTFDAVSSDTLISADKQTAITGHDGGTVRIWNLTDQGIHVSAEIAAGHAESRPHAKVILSHGVLVSCPTGISSRRLLHFLSWDGRERVLLDSEFSDCFPFARDDQFLAHRFNELHVLDQPPMRSRHVYRGHKNTVNAVTFSKDGSWFASCSDDSTLRIWNCDSTSPRRTIAGHEGRIVCVTLTPDERTIISGDDRGFVHFSHVATGRNLFRIRLSDRPVVDLACSRNGRRIAIAHFDRVHLITLSEVLAVSGASGEPR